MKMFKKLKKLYYDLLIGKTLNGIPGMSKVIRENVILIDLIIAILFIIACFQLYYKNIINVIILIIVIYILGKIQNKREQNKPKVYNKKDIKNVKEVIDV